MSGPFGSTMKSEEYLDSGIPFIRIKNIKNSKIDTQDLVYISEENNNIIKNSELHNGDIVLSKIGTIGEFALIEFEKCNISENNIGIKFNGDENINKKYLFYILISSFTKKYLSQNLSGNVQKFLNVQTIKDLKIPLPPLEIQNQIVEKMDLALKEKKEKEMQAKTLLESIDDFVLSELGIEYKEVEEKKVFPISLSELGETKRLDSFYNNPKFLELEKMLKNGKYEIKKVNDFLDDIKYGASLKNDYSETGIPFLRIKDLEKNKINVEEVVYFPESMRKEIGNCIVNEGDFLVSRSGSVGIVALVEKQFEGFAFGSFMIKFSLKENEKVDKEYLQIWLNNRLNQIFIEQEKIGAIQGNITIDTIKNFKIPLPPLEIQEKIALEVKNRIKKAKVLESEAREVYERAKKEVEEMILD